MRNLGKMLKFLKKISFFLKEYPLKVPKIYQKPPVNF